MTLQNRPSRLKTVLIGTSLGEESDQVVRAGVAVARAAGAQVHLVHAAQLEPLMVGIGAGAGVGAGVGVGTGTGSGAALELEQMNVSEEELRRQIARIGIGEAELAGFRVRAGSPYRILADAAQEVAADLIVVGATEAGPLAAELLGSTADRILRKARCPVLIVRGELQVPPRKVLAPVDLSALSGDAFRGGLHLLAQISGSGRIEVRALHALSLVDALAIRQKSGRSVDEIQDSAGEELRRFVLENRVGEPFHVETTAVPGEARQEILRVLEEDPVDLVFLGTHGRGGLDRLVLGSVASTVARKAPCSVLVVPPDAAMEEGTAGAAAESASGE